eukprot:299186-Prorocentrum_minimum.AAC.1
MKASQTAWGSCVEAARGTVAGSRREVVLRRGEAGFWRRALCPRVLHPKRGNTKDLVMCCTKREHLG